MSCYEWERGNIKLSVKEYSRVKKEMIKEVKKYYQTLYQNAIKCYDKMIAVAKGKRGVNWNEIYHNCSTEKKYEYSYGFSSYTLVNLDPLNKLGSPIYNCGESKRPLKPKKKDFIEKINRKDFYISFEGASISFNDKEHSIFWNVEKTIIHVIEQESMIWLKHSFLFSLL